jgi:hypothetical protein
MEDRDGCIILGLDNLEARKVAIACCSRVLIHGSRELPQWMCAKMCSLSQKLYDAGEKPSEDAFEANQGVTVIVSFLRL